MHLLGVGFWNVQGHLTDANDALLTMGGLTREELAGEKFSLLNLIHPEDRGLFGENIRRAVAGEIVFPLELRLSRTDGGLIDAMIILVSSEPNREQNLVYIQDRTQQKQVELSLQESEERFHTMADCSPVLIGTSDLEGKGTYFNKQWLTFTGSSLEEDLGMGWARHFHPEDVGCVMAVYFQAIQTCQPFDVEFRLRRHDGEYRWMMAKGAPRFLPTGEFVGFVASCFDVSQQKQTEQEHQQLLAELEHKVEARTQELQKTNLRLQEAAEIRQNFVSTLTHDLRTPLIAQHRILTTLQDEHTIHHDARISSLVQGFLKNNTDLLRMVNNLLETYELEEGRIKLLPESIQLYDLFRECCGDLEQMAAFKGIMIHYKTAEELPTIDADRILLKRLFQNLIGNAVENIPAGCNIQLKAADVGNNLEIHVTDDGPGIDPAIRPQVFSPYFSKGSMPRKRIGSGLGLYICKMIVELHHGTIKLHSQLGQGTDVCITLPKARPAQDIQEEG